MRAGLCKCAYIERENEEDYCRLKFVAMSWDKTKGVVYTHRVYSKEDTQGLEKGTKFEGVLGRDDRGNWEIVVLDEI